MKALANITTTAVIAFALTVAAAPLAWGATGSISSEVAVLLAHSEIATAPADAALNIEAVVAEAREAAAIEAANVEAAARAAEVAAEAAATEITEVEAPEAPEVEAVEAEAPVLAMPETGAPESLDDTQVMTPSTINVGGHVMTYIDYFEQASAPEVGAGLWLGNDSTTDGSWGYFIGHNPGDFAGVMDLTEGDAVTVCDRDGASRTYFVIDTFTVTTETYWDDIEERVTGFGESITLQTCCGDNVHYRVVVAI